MSECACCHKNKPLKELWPLEYSPTGYSLNCIPCQNKLRKLSERETVSADMFVMQVLRLVIDYIPEDISEEEFNRIQEKMSKIFLEYRKNFKKEVAK